MYKEVVVRKYCLAILLLGLWTSFTLGQVTREERGNLVLENIPEIPQSLKDRMLQYRNTRSAAFQGFHPDQGLLITTRFGRTSQVHWVKQPGGARQQLTFFDEPVSEVAVNPDTSQRNFIFDKDIGGSEFYQLFLYDLGSGVSTLLTDGESRNGAAVWSKSGDRYAYFSTRRNGRDFDILMASSTEPKEATTILQEGGLWVPADWAPDDSKLLVIRYVSAAEAHPYILDLESKELTPVRPSEEQIAYRSALWSKDGKGIYFTSDEGTEFIHLRYLDLANQEVTVLTGDSPWDVDDMTLSDDGNLVAYVLNENGISKLHVRDLASNRDLNVPEVPYGEITGIRFNRDSNKLGMTLNSALGPGDVYVLDVAAEELEQWTQGEVGGLSTESFQSPRLIHFETFDKVDGKPRMIPAFYYPAKRTEGGPSPVLISIHGGPEAQYTPAFSSTFQYLINEMGIAVLAPNVRGSTGYGKSYLGLDNGFKREDTVRDIGELLDWIDEQPELDSDRIAVFGGSYGGYMVLAAMTHYNDRLRAGIDVVGISNFVTFLENTQEYRKDLRRVEYGDERDAEMREFLNRISPNNNAQKITKPLFVIQGLNDPRVPVTESEQMVKVIRDSGGTVWYLLAKDEGHGFRKKENRDFYLNAVVLFLEQHLVN